MTTPVFGSSPAEPPHSRARAAGSPARPPGRKAVGILLAPTTGRAAAFTIIGAPLALFLIIGFEASSSGSSAADSGPSPFSGQIAQSQPTYSMPSPTYLADTANSGVEASTNSAPDDSSAPPTDAAGIGAASAPDTSTASPSSSATGPDAVVLAAYDDINRHDYQAAYNLGLAQNGESYSSFLEGYSNTRTDTIRITGVSGDVVSVSLLALSNDGSQHTYSGTYTVTGGHITGADLQQVN